MDIDIDIDVYIYIYMHVYIYIYVDMYHDMHIARQHVKWLLFVLFRQGSIDSVTLSRQVPAPSTTSLLFYRHWN